MSGEGPGKALIFRLNDNGQGPEIVKQAFLERGWVEYDEDDHAEHEWNLWWRTSRFRTSDHDSLLPWQQLNHYPKSTAITKKDSLARNMKRMKGVHGATVFNFCPNAFNLPNDYTKFVAEYSRLRDKHPEKAQYWICKPADMSRGRGIFVFKDINELNYDCNAVVQTYIQNPLLIAGYKFDLRIYVVVPSFHPLNIYIYQEGLARFSTEKFDLSSLKNVFSHLTNTSINKYGPSYALEKELLGPGCKWTLTQLRHYFRQSNIDDSQLFIKIQYIVILTLLVQANQVPKYTKCFELYGFDIMVDENMKPWLVEVNFSPALATDGQVDVFVKKPMVSDLIEMLGFTEEDKERGGPDFQQTKKNQQDMYPSYIPPAGGRRSGMGYGGPNNKRAASTVLKKRNSQSRLQNLSSAGQSGSTSTLVANTPRSAAATDLEQAEEFLQPPQSLPPKPVSPGQNIIPIIPGCGLPSVQQPGKIGMKNAHQLNNDDSGQSSGCGSESEDEKGDLAVGDVKNATQVRRTHVSGTPRSIYGYENSPLYKSRPQQSTYIKSNNRVTGKNRVNPVAVKKPSKFASASDSGLSSTSGSNSSDYAEQPRADEPRGLSSKQRQQLDITTGQKKNRVPSQPNILNRDFDDEERHSVEKSPSIQNNITRQLENVRKPERYQESSSNKMRSVYPSHRRRPVSFVTNNKLQSDTRIGTASPQRRNLDNGSRMSSQSLSDVRNSQSTSTSRPNRRQQNYEKPWRKTKPKENPPVKPGTPKPSAADPKSRVGDYFLVFPFNEATRKCAQNGLDPRVVIKEAQKMLKDRLASTVVEKSGGTIFSRVDHHDDGHTHHMGGSTTGAASLLHKGSSSARSSQRSLSITLASEKTMLSTATDPGIVPASAKTSARLRRPPLQVGASSRDSRNEYPEIWAPVVLETSPEHANNNF